MKQIHLDQTKFEPLWRDMVISLPYLIIAMIVIAFGILTYIAVLPQEDEVTLDSGVATVDSYDFTFNTKLLHELSNTSQPVSVNESGGRNPFSPF